MKEKNAAKILKKNYAYEVPVLKSIEIVTGKCDFFHFKLPVSVMFCCWEKKLFNCLPVPWNRIRIHVQSWIQILIIRMKSMRIRNIDENLCRRFGYWQSLSCLPGPVLPSVQVFRVPRFFFCIFFSLTAIYAAHYCVSRAGFDVALPLYVPASLVSGAAGVSSGPLWQLLVFPGLEPTHLTQLRHRSNLSKWYFSVKEK
jgi:hypothetical protein